MYVGMSDNDQSMRYGLWLHSSLSFGTSDHTDTFDNEPLAGSQRFEIANIEVWNILE